MPSFHVPGALPLRGRRVAFLAACLLCAGCASHSAKVSGGWRPANTLDTTPQPILRAPATQYMSTPIDQSLRGLLTRWAREGNMALDFQLASDFSLSQEAAAIRASSLEAALEALNRIYADNGVQLNLASGVLVAASKPIVSTTSLSPSPRNSKPKGRK